MKVHFELTSSLAILNNKVPDHVVPFPLQLYYTLSPIVSIIKLSDHG